MEEIPFLRSTCRREDFCASLLGDLDSRQSDASGGGVNKHPLTTPDRSQVAQSVVGGQESDGNGRRLLKGEPSGLFCHGIGGSDYTRTKAITSPSNNFIAWTQCRHAFTYRNDPTSALFSE